MHSLHGMEPWLAAMFAADEAEARGDAHEALSIIASRPLDPYGEPFWRPWRVTRLDQLVTFGPILPGWVTSRWILEQAQSAMHVERRGAATKAQEIAIRLRGGRQTLQGVDEMDQRARVMDRDWVYRQALLYELGGLDHFLRKQATPDLIVGADRIHEWASTAMGGFELVAVDSRTTTWRDLASGAERRGPNIGSAALNEQGDQVIGRLVPIEDGHLFETQPLTVPADVAREVAERPGDWLAILESALRAPGGDEIQTHGLHYQCFVSDVPPSVVPLVIAQFAASRISTTDIDAFVEDLSAAVITAGRVLVDVRGPRPRGAVDIWPCLGAALLMPDVLAELAESLGPAESGLFAELATRLAEPAATVCRELVEEARGAA
jgi:hypothetical protein